MPEKLRADHKFQFYQEFEEISIKTKDNTILNGVLFKAKQSKGLMFYLHGNAGSLDTWGNVAPTYTDLGYNVFLLDYRGYGKSEGTINNENKLYEDNQMVYNEIKKRYSEDKIIVLGYSIGTGMASKLAASNAPKLVILQAPYFNLPDLMKHTYSFIPTALLKYKLPNNEDINQCKVPVVIFHGNNDRVIYYESSLKLQKEFKEKDTLITIPGQGHNLMSDNLFYVNMLKLVLEKHK